MKCRPFPFFTLDPHIALVSSNDLKRKIETNTQTWIGFFFRVCHLVETLKNLLPVFFPDADAEIPDADLSIPGIARNIYQDHICMWRILDSVGNQVNKHLPNAISITINLRFCCTSKAKTVARCGSLKVFYRFFDKRIEVKCFFTIDNFTGQYFGNIQQIGDEFGELV